MIALPFFTGYTRRDSGRERCKEPKSKSRGSLAKKQALLLHSFYCPLQESKSGMEMPKVPVVSRYFVAYLASFVAVAPFFLAKVAPFFRAKDTPQTGPSSSLTRPSAIRLRSGLHEGYCAQCLPASQGHCLV